MADYLADTNVLLRLSSLSSKRPQVAAGLIETLLRRGDALVLVPQNLVEFWAVTTRPLSANGFGWDVERARREVDGLLATFGLFQDTPTVFTHWLSLVTAHQVHGKQVHDARLVAAMLAHGIDQLITLNVVDFKRYPEIRAVHPDDFGGEFVVGEV